MCITRTRRNARNAQLRDAIGDTLVRAVKLLELAQARTGDCGTVLALVDTAQALFEGSAPAGIGMSLHFPR
jgi:hypothetical protein